MTMSSTINYTSETQHVFERISKLNGNNTAKRGSITKSLRLDQDIVSKVEQQASKNGTSFNAEINNMLRKYVEWDMLASTVGMIPIARPVLSEIFQKLLTREQVIDLANSIARFAIHEMALFMKGNLTLESFLSWLKTRMEHCSEVNYAAEHNGRQMMIFKHDLGENWSIYHKIITEHILHEILRENTTIPFHLNIEDKRRVVCTFYKLFKQGKFDFGDVEDTIEALPKEFTNVTRLELHDIAFVIDALAHC